MSQNPWAMDTNSRGPAQNLQSPLSAPLTPAPLNPPSQAPIGATPDPTTPDPSSLSSAVAPVSAGQGAVLQGMQNGMTNLAGLMQQSQQMQAQYPSFPNQAGLGTQRGYTPAPPAPAPAQASSSFNPWSLTGEANAR